MDRPVYFRGDHGEKAQEAGYVLIEVLMRALVASHVGAQGDENDLEACGSGAPVTRRYLIPIMMSFS